MYTEEKPKPAAVREEAEQETPLPATLTFVFIIGVTFLVLWFGVFMLLKERW